APRAIASSGPQRPARRRPRPKAPPSAKAPPTGARARSPAGRRRGGRPDPRPRRSGGGARRASARGALAGRAARLGEARVDVALDELGLGSQPRAAEEELRRPVDAEAEREVDVRDHPVARAPARDLGLERSLRAGRL